jgi:hypothetical protein
MNKHNVPWVGGINYMAMWNKKEKENCLIGWGEVEKMWRGRR